MDIKHTIQHSTFSFIRILFIKKKKKDLTRNLKKSTIKVLIRTRLNPYQFYLARWKNAHLSLESKCLVVSNNHLLFKILLYTRVGLSGDLKKTN